MKKKSLHKKIFFICIFVIVSILIASIALPSYTSSVQKKFNMEGEELEGTPVTLCSEEVGKTNFLERYNIIVDFTDNSFTIKEGEDIKSEIRDIDLYISKMQFVQYLASTSEDKDKTNTYKSVRALEHGSSEFVLNYKSPLTFSKDYVSNLMNQYNIDNDSADTFLITFTSVNDDADPLCKGKITFDVALDLTSFAKAETVNVPLDPDTETPLVFKPITEATVDCSNPQGAFAESYCASSRLSDNPEIKITKMDLSSKLNTSASKTKFSEGDIVTLKCNPQSLVDTSSSVLKDVNRESEYFVNEAILTAQKHTVNTDFHYEYRFAPEYHYYNSSNGILGNSINNVTSVPIKIDVDCKEVVRVQYGPPVATKAGFCFEYNVKATSTVTCTASHIDPPLPPKYCTPVPECYHSSGDWTGPAAGPDDSFEQCIQNCDGGKYSLKCSKQCYNSVYGSSSPKMANKSSQARVQKLADSSSCESKTGLDQCLCYEEYGAFKYEFSNYHKKENRGKSYFGCYYWDAAGKIAWYGGNDGYARESQSSMTKNEVRITPGRWYGFHRKTSDLSAFESNNDGFLRKVFANNLCGAVCTWTGCGKNEYLNPAIAAADYKKNVKQYNDAVNYATSITTCSVSTTKFKVEVTPYGSNIESADSLISKPSDHTIEDKDKELTNKHYLRDFSGCYQKSKVEDDGGEWFKALWGLPGTWMDLQKTLNISYKPKNGYTYLPHKFCLPSNISTVNEKLWRYYYSNKFEGDDFASYKEEMFKNNCCVVTPIERKDISESDVEDWNITASTREFGHFGWNIDISCFYSYDTTICTPTDNPPPECKSNIENRVRSVDLNNLFPDVDGGGDNDPATPDREPPHNWSNKALQIKKDPNYISDGVALTKWIQSNGDSIYDNESELDYRIVLTRQDFVNIKADLKENEDFGIALTDYVPSESIIPKSVTNYKSKLLREVLHNSKNKLPQGNLIYCNNIHGDKCLTFNE